MPPSPTEPLLLAARELRVGYLGRALLPAIDLELHAGQLWALVGRNGSGKSTALRTLLAFLAPVSGSVSRAPGCNVSYVPQRGDLDAIVPGRVHDFVRGGADSGWSFLSPLFPGRQHEHIERAMRDTETRELADWPFADLSEGQRQRVVLARALASEPRLLVLDEPTSAMDAMAEASIFELLDRLRRDRGLGVLIVSHQVPPLVRRATHALFVDKEAGLVRVGTADEVTRSGEFVARYGDVSPVRDLRASEERA